MTAARRRLVLHLVRFANACEAIEQRMYEALEFDAGFDAGEFSGPAHARAARREMDRAARRLGFTSAQVAEQVSEEVL